MSKLPLYEVEPGQIILPSSFRDQYVLPFSSKEITDMLGYEPPSLPLLKVRENGNGFEINGNKPEVLRRDDEVELVGEYLSRDHIRGHILPEFVEAYKIFMKP